MAVFILPLLMDPLRKSICGPDLEAIEIRILFSCTSKKIAEIKIALEVQLNSWAVNQRHCSQCGRE